MECSPGLMTIGEEILILTNTFMAWFRQCDNIIKRQWQSLRSFNLPVEQWTFIFFMRRSKNGTVFIAHFVDGNLMIGDGVAIDEAIVQLKKNGLDLNIEKKLTDYLSCNILFETEKNKAWIGQQGLVKKVE